MIPHTHKRALRRELVREGVFTPRPAVVWLKFSSMIAALAALVAAAAALPLWGTLLAVPLAAFPAMTATVIGHEAAHGSFARGKGHNALMLHLAFPLLGGLSATYWKHKHNHLHHSHPNVPGTDRDIELWPFATSAQDYARSGRLRRWMQRSMQAYLFWPATLLLGFLMRIHSVSYLAQRQRRCGLGRAGRVDALCLVGHYALWLVAPSFFFGVLPVVLFYLALWAIVGLMLALIFAPAHMGLPLVRGRDDKWMHQLETTRNLRMPAWMSWMVVGLDHQVEHHLFPNIPHLHMRRAAGIVARWCREHGAPYQEIGYGRGVADVTRFISMSWRYDPDAPDIEPSPAPR